MRPVKRTVARHDTKSTYQCDKESAISHHFGETGVIQIFLLQFFTAGPTAVFEGAEGPMSGQT
jgi:hypothetical protein